MRIAAFDRDDLPLEGVTVRFDVIKGSGSISTSATFSDLVDGVNPARNLSITTDASGQGQVWLTLGAEAGLASHVVKAWSDELSEAIYFTASSQVGEPVRVVIEDGAGTQYAQTHSQPLHTPTVVALDAAHNPVPGAQVQFSIRSGDAEFSNTSAPDAVITADGLSVVTITDKKGQASARPYLGASDGLTVIEAQSLTSTGDLAGSTQFQIVVKTRSNAPTRFSGVVMDMSGYPLPGVTLSLGRSSLSTLSDEDGFFRFEGNVPVGRIDLFIDGRDVTMEQNGQTVEYPALHFEATVIQGQDNQLPHIIYLPPVHTERAQVVGGSEDVILTIPGYDGFEMIVKADSVTFPDGSRTGELVVNPVHADRLPMVPPGGAGRFSPFGWTLQPTGTRFDPPIEVRIPNVDGFKPGTTMPVVQWDHDLAQFVPMGLGTVTADGTQLITEPGSGITKAGWGGGQPPPPPTNDGTNQCPIGGRSSDCECQVTIRADRREDELYKELVEQSPGSDDYSANVGFTLDQEGDCGELELSWNFGDVSALSYELTPTHEYTVDGLKVVRVDALSSNGDSYFDEINVNLIRMHSECIVTINEPALFKVNNTIDSNNIEWNTSIGGNPATFTGNEYNVVFENQYNSSNEPKTDYKTEVTVKVLSDSSVRIQDEIWAAQTCVSYEPTFVNEVIIDDSLLLRPYPNDIGSIEIEISPDIRVRSCVNENQWSNRIVLDSPTYDIEVDFKGRIELLTPESDLIDNDNCVEVIKDLTPINSGRGYIKAPNRFYVVPNIINDHEAGHLADVINIITNPRYNEFKPLVDDLESRLNECKVQNPYEEIVEPFKDRTNELYALYETDKEKRVYERVENPALLLFINKIRERAERENWEETLCY